MDRVRDHISFVVWFVGLSYVALWPTATGDSSGAVALSPGLHLLGMLAAFWVAIRLIWLLVAQLLRAIMPRLPLLPFRRVVSGRLRQSWRSAMQRLRKPPPPRWVKPRREFGLRDPR